jgi:hypothetical protein
MTLIAVVTSPLHSLTDWFPGKKGEQTAQACANALFTPVSMDNEAFHHELCSGGHKKRTWHLKSYQPKIRKSCSGGGWLTFPDLLSGRLQLRVPHSCVLCKGGWQCCVQRTWEFVGT